VVPVAGEVANVVVALGEFDALCGGVLDVPQAAAPVIRAALASAISTFRVLMSIPFRR
jgi:hypothetical protein